MSNCSAQELLVRMLGKKLFAVLWRANADAELGHGLREHLEYMSELERRGVLFASGPLSGKPGDGLSILRAATIEDVRAIAEPDPFVTKGLRGLASEMFGDAVGHEARALGIDVPTAPAALAMGIGSLRDH
jgi:uncharacterized protein YciI